MEVRQIKYGELNLREIRDLANIDFAHFTYRRGQCSCCYGPKDLPKMYWKNRVIPEHDDYSYILFKNAKNDSGKVTKNDEISDGTCISWHLTEEQLDIVCRCLQEQLGLEYLVEKHENHYTCIVLRKVV